MFIKKLLVNKQKLIFGLTVITLLSTIAITIIVSRENQNRQALAEIIATIPGSYGYGGYGSDVYNGTVQEGGNSVVATPAFTQAPTTIPTDTPMPLPTATPIPLPTATPIPLPTNTTTPSLSTNVIWTSLVNTTANGSTLTKSAGGTGWNAGAISSQKINSGNGYGEITINDNLSQYRYFGLNHNNTTASYTDIDYALYFLPNGYVYVYENGAYKGKITPYALGNTFKIALEAGKAKYYKNNVLFYTSTLAPIYPLFVDASLYTVGSKIPNAKIVSQ